MVGVASQTPECAGSSPAAKVGIQGCISYFDLEGEHLSDDDQMFGVQLTLLAGPDCGQKPSVAVVGVRRQKAEIQ